MAPALRHRNLPQLLLESREALMGHFRPLLNAQGVTDQQWRILRALLIDGPQEPHQLCARCAISSPSITGVLQRMEEAGWLRRERMAEDARRVKVSLTARSRRLGERLLPAVEARYAQLEAALGVARLQQVYDDLDALMASLAELAEGTGRGAEAAPEAVAQRTSRRSKGSAKGSAKGSPKGSAKGSPKGSAKGLANGTARAAPEPAAPGRPGKAARSAAGVAAPPTRRRTPAGR